MGLDRLVNRVEAVLERLFTVPESDQLDIVNSGVPHAETATDVSQPEEQFIKPIQISDEQRTETRLPEAITKPFASMVQEFRTLLILIFAVLFR